MRGEAQINPRRMQKRIEIISLDARNDGFGGQTTLEVSRGFFWADWRSIGANSKSITDLGDLGIKDFSQVFKISLRTNVLIEDIERTRLKYKNVIYDILNIQNVHFRNIKTVLIIKEHRSE